MMKRFRLPIIIAICCCLEASAENRHHFYLRYSHSEGLPATNISSCCQDGFGRLWVGTREGVYYYSGSAFVPLLNPEYLETCSPNTFVLAADNDNCVWIGSTEGVGWFDSNTDSFHELNGFADSRVSDVAVTDDGIVWFTSHDGLWKYAKDGNMLERIEDTGSLSPFRACVVENGCIAFTARNDCVYIYNTRMDNLRVVKVDGASSLEYVESIGGTHLLVSDGAKTVRIVDISSGLSEIIVDADVIENKAEVFSLMYRSGLCWIGTSYGLVIYDTANGTIERQFPDQLDNNCIGGESIRCLFSDDMGNVWAGTYNGGLRGWASYEKGFRRFVSDGSVNSLNGDSVRSFCMGLDGRIFIGTEEGYISLFNPVTKNFEDLTLQSHIAYGTAVTAMCIVGNTLWVATYGDGLITIDARNGQFIKKYGLECNDCLSMLQASDGNLYVGTGEGLLRYERAADRFVSVPVIGRRFVHCMIEDEPGRLLMGMYGKGFGIYDMVGETFRTEDIAEKGNIISSLYKDSRNMIWLASSGSGLFRFSLSSISDGSGISDFKVLDMESGLPTLTVKNMLEDDDGMLWVSTSDGLVELDPVSCKVRRTYLQRDNVIGCQFSYCDGLKTDDGVFYMGTDDGMLMFEPRYFRERFKNSRLRITSIGLLTDFANQSIQRHEGRSGLNTDLIRVRQKDATYLSFSFSSFEYGSPNKVSYDCTLSAPRFTNHFTTSDNSLAFTNLRKGKYTFTVNYSGCDDPAVGAKIDVVVKAPWYSSHVAIVMYISFIAALFYAVFRERNKRKTEEIRRMNELIEAKREKDRVHEKMDLLTNIAHEIRTPVSVIQILLDKVLSGKGMLESAAVELESMKINVDNLNHLCNELLDFRKIDSGQSMMVFADEDIQPICKKVVKSFATPTRNMGIDLVTRIPETPLHAHCDDSAIESVLCNLLSNAVKYCHSRIVFSVEENAGKVVIRMENDGERIPDEDKDNIFNAFYHTRGNRGAGSGLGLTYSRKIAEMHGGSLYLDTEVSEMTSFVFEIPVSSPAAVAVPSSKGDADDDELLYGDKDRTTILVVEDNRSMRELIRDELSHDYGVQVASDGLEALQIVKDGHIDLVVSDIMMPKMDGCQLCNAIKEDMQLSHIPVLLLTAAVGIETHIRSLKSGADAYIEKPFKMDVLKENINALFRNRDIRNRQFSSSPLSHLSCATVSKVEQDFINRLHGYIIDHISESELSTGTLADVMNVSKPTLARKIKASTGLTVTEYVRLCRLKMAAEMLAENKYRINEVAYLVGYTSPSYFAQCFQKQFNKLPSDFIKNN